MIDQSTRKGSAVPADPDYLRIALKGVCPACGKGSLWRRRLTFRESCDVCGQDFSKADPGDGPAVAVIFIAGFAGIALLFVLQFGLGLPPVAALPLVAVGSTVLSIGLLRPIKALFFAIQHHQNAAEDRQQ